MRNQWCCKGRSSQTNQWESKTLKQSKRLPLTANYQIIMLRVAGIGLPLPTNTSLFLRLTDICPFLLSGILCRITKTGHLISRRPSSSFLKTIHTKGESCLCATCLCWKIGEAGLMQPLASCQWEAIAFTIREILMGRQKKGNCPVLLYVF